LTGALAGVVIGVAVSVAVGMLVGVLVSVAVGVLVGVLVSVAVGVLVGVLVGGTAFTACCIAANASMMPAPLSRSTPAASMSIALLIRNERIWACVKAGLTDLTSAAIAPACGAAAEVPKNGLNPGAAVLTPSAAVRSGFWIITPPPARKFPGVIALPSAA
jgi:hypothetical protein